MHRLNLKVGLVLVAVIALAQMACGAESVSKASYDKQSLELENAKKKIEELQKDLAAKPQHHYSLERTGLRTFRFDSTTGKSCIMLTSKQDWKDPDTKANSCDCDDLLNSATIPSAWMTKLSCGY